MNPVAFTAKARVGFPSCYDVIVGHANSCQPVKRIPVAHRNAHLITPSSRRTLCPGDVDQAGSFFAGTVGSAADGGNVQQSLLFVHRNAEKRVGIQATAIKIVVDIIAQCTANQCVHIEPPPDAHARNGVVAAEIGKLAVQFHIGHRNVVRNLAVGHRHTGIGVGEIMLHGGLHIADRGRIDVFPNDGTLHIVWIIRLHHSVLAHRIADSEQCNCGKN